MNKNKLILFIVISIFLLFCIIFKPDYNDFTISQANIETSLNPGIFVKFKSPNYYGMNKDQTEDATKIIGYIISLKSVTNGVQYLRYTALLTDRGYTPEFSLSWRKLSDTNKIVSGDGIENLSKINTELCIKIDKDNINLLKPLHFYQVGIIAVNNFYQYSAEHIVDTKISMLSCANIPSTMCWAKFSNDFSLPSFFRSF